MWIAVTSVGLGELGMNDFTKEELEDLIFCVKDHTGYQDDSIHVNLIKKIQFLIDNYKAPCEHQWKEFTSLVNHCKLCSLYELVTP